MVKNVIIAVLVLVVALLIYGYLVDPVAKFQIQESVSNIKTNLFNGVDNIPSLKENSCKEAIDDLIPNVLILSLNKGTQINNYWSDGSFIEKDGKYCWDKEFTLNDFRKGFEDGENINYYYYNDVDCNITFSKQIVDEEGNILGTKKFDIRPVIKLSDKQIETSEGEFDASTNKFVFTWNGFNDEMKELYGSETLELKIVTENLLGSQTICSYESDEDDDVYYCDGLSLQNAGWEGTFGTCIWCDKFLIEPDIYNNKIYEIIDSNIQFCKQI